MKRRNALAAMVAGIVTLLGRPKQRQAEQPAIKLIDQIALPPGGRLIDVSFGGGRTGKILWWDTSEDAKQIGDSDAAT